MRALTPRRLTSVFLVGLVAVLAPQGCSSGGSGSCAGTGGTVEECKQGMTAAQCDSYNTLAYNGSTWSHSTESCTARGYGALCGDGTYTKAVSECQVEPSPAADSGSPSGGCTTGNYKCSGDTVIMRCVGRSWTVSDACTCSVSVGDPRKPPYSSTCKSSGTGSIECSYAGSRCMKCTPTGGCVDI